MTVLNEKNVPYDITYIDLRNKPDWFLEISPTGKVPVVQTADGVALFESAVINEYLDEVHEPHFMPQTPLARAQERMWSDFMTGLYGNVFRLYTAANEETVLAESANARERLERLDGVVKGPLFNGERFSLLDATAAPPFMRFDWIRRVAPEINPFHGLPNVTSWRDALLARPAVQSAVLPEIYDLFLESLQRNKAWIGRNLAYTAG